MLSLILILFIIWLFIYIRNRKTIKMYEKTEFFAGDHKTLKNIDPDPTVEKLNFNKHCYYKKFKVSELAAWEHGPGIPSVVSGFFCSNCNSLLDYKIMRVKAEVICPGCGNIFTLKKHPAKLLDSIKNNR
jgi:hypothetical protein